MAHFNAANSERLIFLQRPAIARTAVLFPKIWILEYCCSFRRAFFVFLLLARWPRTSSSWCTRCLCLKQDYNSAVSRNSSCVFHLESCWRVTVYRSAGAPDETFYNSMFQSNHEFVMFLLWTQFLRVPTLYLHFCQIDLLATTKPSISLCGCFLRFGALMCDVLVCRCLLHSLSVFVDANLETEPLCL